MDDFVDVGAVRDFPEGRGRAVDFEGRKVAVFKLGGRFHAVQDKCPHMAASLADSRVEAGDRIACHMHGWRFDLATGEGLPPAKSWAEVCVYEVRVEAERVYLRRPSGPPPQPEEDWPVWDDERHLKKRR